MSWLGDKVGDAIDVATRVRYGMSPEEKDRLMYERSLPGAPSNTDPVGAKRYTSTYLAAKKWGKLPAELFNALALSDITREDKDRVKGIGAAGAEAGALAGLADEVKRRERLLALFRGERIDPTSTGRPTD